MAYTLTKAKQMLLLVSMLSLYSLQGVYANELSLKRAVQLAQKNDPWLQSNQHNQSAIDAMAMSSATLPDPKLSLGLANMPIDSFDFNQEGMTQLKAGISQMFPRGDSLTIKNKQLQLLSGQYPYQRQDRLAKVEIAVAGVWLDAFLAQQSIALIEADRRLFDDLADIAQASYSSAVGKTRQQDIIRSQLELTRLEDRLSKLYQQQEMAQQKLLQWVNDYYLNQEHNLNASSSNITKSLTKVNLSQVLPTIPLQHTDLIYREDKIDLSLLNNYFSKHPALKSLDKKIEATRIGISLAKQKYKPEWGVNASYGYRGDDLMGNDRSDFLSVGITLDLPIFTSNRQDQQLQAEVSKTEAVKTDKWLLLRKMISAFETQKAKINRLNQRQNLYALELLPQINEQANASLAAYTNDDGDFAEVVRARIAELNAKIDKLSIDVERQKTIIQLNYLFTVSKDPSTNAPVNASKQIKGKNNE